MLIGNTQLQATSEASYTGMENDDVKDDNTKTAAEVNLLEASKRTDAVYNFFRVDSLPDDQITNIPSLLRRLVYLTLGITTNIGYDTSPQKALIVEALKTAAVTGAGVVFVAQTDILPFTLTAGFGFVATVTATRVASSYLDKPFFLLWNKITDAKEAVMEQAHNMLTDKEISQKWIEIHRPFLDRMRAVVHHEREANATTPSIEEGSLV